MNEKLANLSVTDRKSFIEFIELLLEDFQEHPETWENKSVPSFLIAIGAYAEDIQGYYDNQRLKINADEPSWQTFAHILKAATLYE